MPIYVQSNASDFGQSLWNILGSRLYTQMFSKQISISKLETRFPTMREYVQMGTLIFKRNYKDALRKKNNNNNQEVASAPVEVHHAIQEEQEGGGSHGLIQGTNI